MLSDTDAGAPMARKRKVAGKTSGPFDPISIKFGERLQHYAAEKGWNQADLAREASKHLPKGKVFRRDNISLYTRGIQMPGDARLYALAKALGVQPTDLVPEAISQDTPPLAMKPLEGNNVWLQINQAVTMEMAMDIAAILRKRSE